MVIDEVVETSDLEELAELEAARRTKSPTPFKAYDLNMPRSPPRKKAKLYHEFDNDEAGKLFVSPAKSLSVNTSTPNGSQSSSTMLGTTSPVHSISRSSTRTPGSSHGASFMKVESGPPPPILSFAAPIETGSQDPLLLESPVVSAVSLPQELSKVDVNDPFKEIPAVERSTTPVSSPPGPRLRFPSIDPLNLFGTSPATSSPLRSPAAGAEDPAAQESAKDDPDDLFMFSPVKEAFQHSSSSPLFSPSPRTSPRPLSPKSPTPQSRHRTSSDMRVRSPSPERQSDRSHRSPSPRIGHAVQREADRRVAEAIHEEQEQAQGGRYSLRARKDAQLKPYTIDRLRYKITLKDNPDAIIKDKVDHHRHRHPDDHYEEEETQGDNEEERRYEEELRKRALREEKHRRREEAQQNESEQRQGSVKYLGILQEELPASDDEEAKEIRKLSKEGRRLLKEQEKQKKAQEKGKQREQPQQETHRTKRFPFAEHIAGPSKASSSLPRSSRTSINDADEVIVLDDRLDSQTPSQRRNSSSRESDLLRTYFADDEEFGIDGNDNGDAGAVEQPPEATPHHRLPSSPTIGSAGVAPENVIEVDSDSAEEQVRPRSRARSRRSERSTRRGRYGRNFTSKQERALYRMMPMVMINRMYKKAGEEQPPERQRQPSPEEVSADDDDSGPVPAGHIRRKKMSQPKEVPKGDSESESEIEIDSSSDSDSEIPGLQSADEYSDVDDILTAYGHQPKKSESKPQVIDVDDYDNELTEDEDEVEFVSFTRAKRKGATARHRDPTMIDYMLAKPDTFDSANKARPRKKRSSPSLDIMTRGARRYGRERQTLLSFDNHQKSKKRTDGAKFNTSVKTSRPRNSLKVGAAHNFNDDIPDTAARGRSVPKEGRGERKRHTAEVKRKLRELAVKSRLYVHHQENRYIESGRVLKTAYASILQTVQFVKALAPEASRASVRSPVLSQKSHEPIVLPESARSQGSDNLSMPAIQKDETERTPIPSDFKIDQLPGGTSFPTLSYIRKGWLHDLVNVAFSTGDPVQPPSVSLLGFKFDPIISAEDFSLTFPRICGSFADFAIGLPSPDDEVLSTQWSNMTHYTSQAVSWCLKNGAATDVGPLRDTIKNEVVQLLPRIEEQSTNSVEIPLLAITWFAVELSAKVGPRSVPLSVDGRPEGLLKDTTTMLMRLLLQYGLEKVLMPFEASDASSVSWSAYFIPELWVRLIHLLSRCAATEEMNTRKSHPFWLVLLDALDIHIRANDTTMSSFEISELIWRTIYTFCALAHFSAYGMIVAQSHLPASWEVATFALKSIRLTQMPPDNYKTRKGAFLRRDIDLYVALIVNRCFLLPERWGWSLTEAIPMFSHLVEIFRSRKFANLLHEKRGWPKFLKEANWELVHVYDHRDTAFTMFLKLVFKTIKEIVGDAGGKIPPKARKLLSMAIPMSALPFSKANPPKPEDLPMFYNRISALAIAGEMEESDCKSQIDTAQRYITFSDADYKSRIAVLNGMARWARLMVSRGRSLQAMGKWIHDMATITRTEFDATPKQGSESSSDLNFVRFFAHALLCQVRNIFVSYMKRSRYPDPVLLSSLEPILKSTELVRSEALKPEAMELNGFGHFISALFDARERALPPPPRPFTPPVPSVDEDSQDYWGMDVDLDNVDWNVADVPALVAPAETNNEANDEKEAKLRSSFSSVKLKWHIYHFMKNYFTPPKPGEDIAVYTSECDFWIRTWLRCVSVERLPSDDWSNDLNLLQKVLDPEPNDVKDISKGNAEQLEPRNERWIRRVNLSIMFQALKLKPMLYPPRMNDAFQAFLHALASDNNTNIEAQPRKAMEQLYVAFMLSIDCLQHPLFSRLETLLPPRSQESGDYELSPEQFLALRLPLLDAIFKNLDNLVRKEREGHLDVPLKVGEYVKFCQTMFSAMRYSLSKSDKSSAKYLADNDFCFEVVNTLRKYPALSSRQELNFFVHGWFNALIPPRAHLP